MERDLTDRRPLRREYSEDFKAEVLDIFIACVDGLKGFPDAIEALFPKAVVQLCIVHMVRKRPVNPC